SRSAMVHLNPAERRVAPEGAAQKHAFCAISPEDRGPRGRVVLWLDGRPAIESTHTFLPSFPAGRIANAVARVITLFRGASTRTTSASRLRRYLGHCMIVGTGIDIAETARIEEAMGRHGDRFARRIFTAGEIEYCEQFKNKAERYAARFAA